MNIFFKSLRAAGSMDWQQVALNGGPPCFHLEDDGGFCGRAERWQGHGLADFHKFVSLHQLLAAVKEDGRMAGMNDAMQIIGARNPHSRSAYAEVRGACQAEIRNAINASTPKP